MSGPKSYDYDVVEDPAVVAARLEAQALRMARGRVDAALARLAAVRQEAAGLRERHGEVIAEVSVPAGGEHATSGETVQLAERLEQAAAESEGTLRAQVAAARKASFLAKLAGNGPGGGSHGLERLRDAAATQEARSRADQQTPHAERLAEECMRVFERLRDDVSEAARDHAERVFTAAVADPHAERAPLLVDRLRAAVVTANAEAAEREQRIHTVDALLAGLGALDDEQARRLRVLLLAERTSGRPVAALEAEVEAARIALEQRRSAERRAKEREQVAAALRGAFAELGYDVQGEFEVALNGSGSALARRSGWGDEHAVRVQLDAQTDRLRLHVVRDDRPRLDAALDVEREKQLCLDRPALERALAARKVRVAPQRLIEPGAVPVAVVPLAGTLLPAAGRGRESVAEQQR